MDKNRMLLLPIVLFTNMSFNQNNSWNYSNVTKIISNCVSNRNLNARDKCSCFEQFVFQNYRMDNFFFILSNQCRFQNNLYWKLIILLFKLSDRPCVVIQKMRVQIKQNSKLFKKTFAWILKWNTCSFKNWN